MRLTGFILCIDTIVILLGNKREEPTNAQTLAALWMAVKSSSVSIQARSTAGSASGLNQDCIGNIIIIIIIIMIFILRLGNHVNELGDNAKAAASTPQCKEQVVFLNCPMTIISLL